MSDSHATKAMPAEPRLGRVGRYVLRRELASGGMATVYLAHLEGPHGFEKVVAVKRIHPHLTNDRRFVSMFLDEARVAALIHHPNVCAVTDFGESEGAPYLVMEYLNGEAFSTVLKRVRRDDGPNPFWLSARIVHDAARGLHTAHTQKGADGEPLGVVHRDVSPQNIFVLYDGVTKVVDFGVARARGRLSTTQTNEVKGKLPFMSPEQFENQSVDARTDLWALGVVLWEATVGRRLFRGQNDGATIALVLNKPIPRPSDFVPDYPAKLENIIMKCLERDLSRRYQTGDELADDLEEFLYAFGKPAGASQVRKWMESHFAEEIAYREGLLRGESPAKPNLVVDAATPTLSSVRSLPEPLRLDDEAMATVAAARIGTLRVASELDGVTADPKPARRHRWESVIFALLTMVAVVTMLGVVIREGMKADGDEAVTPVVAPPMTQAVPTTLPVVTEPTPSDVVAPEAEPTAQGATTEARVIRAPREATPVAVVTSSIASPPPAPVVEPEPVREAAPEPTREAAPAAAPGTLSLIAIPAASVRVDGRASGETPLRLSLAPGAHRVELRDPEGRTRSVTVQIESGVTTRQRVEF